MPTPTALAVTGLVAGTLLAAPGLAGSASAADLTTCHGKAATQVIQTTGSYVGTPGDDVVVIDAGTQRAPYSLQTGDGADTVCVHGPAVLFLGTGNGDDLVDTTAVQHTTAAAVPDTQVSLGLGNDTFLGGPAFDVVNDSDAGLVGTSTPAGVDDDDISTGDGPDQVTSQRGSDTVSTGAGDDSFQSFGAEPDAVDLGDGNDSVQASTPAFTSLRGGSGTDQLTAFTSNQPASIDNVAQRLVLDGRTVAYDSFETFEVSLFGTSSLHFRGSDAPETLRTLRSASANDGSGTRTLDADMGGGDDTLEVDQTMVGTWSGGAGRDLLTHDRTLVVPTQGSKPAIIVDLARGFAKVRGNGRASLDSFERVALTTYPTVRVKGSAKADEIILGGCRTQVSGGSGKDRITLVSPSGCKSFTKASVLHGDGGADKITGFNGPDTMYGDAGNDVLRGGKGHDAAYGGPGRDRCTAERRVSC